MSTSTSEAAFALKLQALGLDPTPADLALALPAMMQIEEMAREIHERLKRSPRLESLDTAPPRPG